MTNEELGSYLFNLFSEGVGEPIVFVDINSLVVSSVEEHEDGTATLHVDYNYDMDKIHAWAWPWMLPLVLSGLWGAVS